MLINTNLSNANKISFNDTKNLFASSDRYISTKQSSIQQNYSLSTREYECLSFLARGKRVKEIALLLNLSPRTVESYVNIIKRKMNCFSTGKAIDIYWQDFENNNLSYLPFFMCF